MTTVLNLSFSNTSEEHMTSMLLQTSPSTQYLLN